MDSTGENQRQALAYDAKRRILSAQQRHHSCFILIEGLLIRERFLEGRRRRIVGLHVPGDVCNLAALSDVPAEDDMVALSPVTCIRVPREWLSSIARQSTVVSEAIWREMSREAAISAAWTVNVGHRPAYQRIAYFMCEFEARLRAAGQDMGGGFQWPGTQVDLGAATGLSLVHVNKTLRRLQSEELVARGRRMKFFNAAKLAAIAGFDPSYLALERETLGDVLLARIGAMDAVQSEQAFGSRAKPPTDPTAGRFCMVS